MTVTQKTGKVTIRGSGMDTVLLIDGERPQNLKAFTLRGSGPNNVTTLTLEVAVFDLDVQGDYEIEVDNG